MQGFLQEVAADLYERYGDDISSLFVLFPSRRARVFFVDALSKLSDRPLWEPRWTTVDELMSEISGLRVGDRVRLITELYKVYSEFHPESFDKFYFWGEMLLTDFDTIDKYRIDADMLFRNLSDLKELESDISYLTPVQLQVITTFWSHFLGEGNLSDEKRRFLKIWQSLGPVYKAYRQRLQSLGLAYTGMVHRAAAERLDAGDFSFSEPKRFVVAGFNALSQCEKRLFKFLADSADFYWDYDTYYKGNPEQEAGMFIRENLSMFPSRSELSHDHFLFPKRIEAISTVSNAAQCKYVATLLRELAAEQGPLGKETAIVLTDENLLLPLLHALPPEIGKVNVTMGYPLKQSLSYSFVERLIELQSHARLKEGRPFFYHADVLGILSHPYVIESDPSRMVAMQEEIVRDRRIMVDSAWLRQLPVLEVLFRSTGDWHELSDYLLDVLQTVAHYSPEDEDSDRRLEFLTVISEEIVKLRNSLDMCDVELTTSIYTSLLRRHLQTLRVPYEGEPLEGVQVMGILETRNLDFRNVILLSMNDDNFPGNRMAGSSFVPYNLKAAYGLPTPEHHEGVYAYYFYRLLQRAENVRMLYCSHADEKTTGEQSRYIYQLAYETPFELKRREVGIDVNLSETEPIEVPKTGATAEKLARFTCEENPVALSPTSFFRYVACPLRFYFHSVARLQPDDEISEEVDAPMFGTILHAAMQQLYEPLIGQSSQGDTLRALSRSEKVEQAVVDSINANYLIDPEATLEDYSGNLLLVKDIVTRYIRQGILPFDAAHDGFTVEGLEQPIRHEFAFESAGKPCRVVFGGMADRIDRLADGTLRVVDYKTGEPHLEFQGVDALFHGDAKQRQSNVLQTLIYSMVLYHTRRADTEPTLYYVRAMNREDYRPQLVDRELGRTGVRYSEYREEFEGLLRETLAELFDPSVPFRQTDDVEHTCRYCDFKEICRR
ncbi:MAG TPA: PD-(D/E)XK nuclease family protein [Candidatus Alistipes avicola]|uniref:PD-(D/E)XK nuclease family protein n=1 Tax=Candidatus Alistipes avicola TaxID=2838432 RepID=A0A9D2IDV0_9BACT|nr:PD-(D/E)XK nuclease family protein [Candidatus Alistipes avicola]